MLCWNRTWIGRVSHHTFLFEGNELSKQQSNGWLTEAAAIGTKKNLDIKRIPSTVTKIRPEPISARERARQGTFHDMKSLNVPTFLFRPHPPLGCICENQIPQPTITQMSRKVQHPFKQLLGVLHMSPFSIDPRCPVCFKSWSTAKKKTAKTCKNYKPTVFSCWVRVFAGWCRTVLVSNICQPVSGWWPSQEKAKLGSAPITCQRSTPKSPNVPRQKTSTDRADCDP